MVSFSAVILLNAVSQLSLQQRNVSSSRMPTDGQTHRVTFARDVTSLREASAITSISFVRVCDKMHEIWST
jgi:hypothetical protein